MPREENRTEFEIIEDQTQNSPSPRKLKVSYAILGAVLTERHRTVRAKEDLMRGWSSEKRVQFTTWATKKMTAANKNFKPTGPMSMERSVYLGHLNQVDFISVDSISNFVAVTQGTDSNPLIQPFYLFEVHSRRYHLASELVDFEINNEHDSPTTEKTMPDTDPIVDGVYKFVIENTPSAPQLRCGLPLGTLMYEDKIDDKSGLELHRTPLRVICNPSDRCLWILFDFRPLNEGGDRETPPEYEVHHLYQVFDLFPGSATQIAKLPNSHKIPSLHTIGNVDGPQDDAEDKLDLILKLPQGRTSDPLTNKLPSVEDVEKMALKLAVLKVSELRDTLKRAEASLAGENTAVAPI
jgi:hypothetical protein